MTDDFINILKHIVSWQSLKITKICFLGRLDRKFYPACIATASKESDSSSNCKSKSMVAPSSEEMLGDKAMGPDECFLFYGLSCGFVNYTNK